MQEKDYTAAFDPFADIEFIVFNIIVKAVLFDQGNIVFFQIALLGIINFFNVIALLFQELDKTPSRAAPMFKITYAQIYSP